MNEKIVSYLRSLDNVSYADIIDAAERGRGECIYFSPSSGIIWKHSCGTLYIAGDADEELLSHIPSSGLAAVHSDSIAKYMIDELGWEGNEPTYLFVYNKNECFEDNPLVGLLTIDSLHFVMENYNVSSEHDIAKAIESGHLFALFSDDGKIMAFAGFHEEDAMGMLTVLPEYRRNGYGELLEKHLISTCLKENRKAFCNVFVSNAPSIALQNKLGLVRAPILSWWIWKDLD
ncbi:MAG: GNAT family N-acetyltransferase [Spirochaetes bacterium]|uniref:GNAT family N-acetyltransferase n=1 Tax=Candidatus Ornithospirochaeta stercoripullorum TaxID=2840899 RepID=A0A9D9H2M6_9SPIO|nr:GNAT family N-acetyltransferase [Candidatus Ornithospirochaeta stercoripullorum]